MDGSSSASGDGGDDGDDAVVVDAKLTIGGSSRGLSTQARWSGDEKLVNGLLFDYFARNDLEHSAAVFVPEIGGMRNVVAVDTILQVEYLHSLSSLRQAALTCLHSRCISVNPDDESETR